MGKKGTTLLPSNKLLRWAMNTRTGWYPAPNRKYYCMAYNLYNPFASQLMN